MAKSSDKKLEYQREYNKRTNYASQNKYHKERGKVVSIRLFTPQDDDILEFLDAQPNKAGYFRELVRADMEKKKAQN